MGTLAEFAAAALGFRIVDGFVVYEDGTRRKKASAREQGMWDLLTTPMALWCA